MTKQQRYYKRHRNQVLIQKKQYYKKNKIKILNYERKYVSHRMKLDVNFKIKRLLRKRLYNALKDGQKNGSAVRDLGCSIRFLKAYIESKFKKGMSWKNWGYGLNKWNIDHIVPLSSFDFTDKDQILQACHYTNLQPLWQPENLSKGSK